MCCVFRGIKAETDSEFGSKFDTVADLILVVVCLIKLIPVLNIELWMCISWVLHQDITEAKCRLNYENSKKMR